jgi:hypothetical protein
MRVKGVCELMSKCLLVDTVYGIDSVLMDKTVMKLYSS